MSYIGRDPTTKGAGAVDASTQRMTLASDDPAVTALDGIYISVDGLETQTGAVNETAPASDTASSGVNGRLQRIAQRLTSLIALLPTSLAANGGLKIEGVASGTAVPVSAASGSIASGAVASGAVVDGAMVTIGAKADAKSTATDTTAITAMSVWKQISASVQAIATSIAATLSTNVAQLAGTTTDTNSGVKSAGTLRVVLATDQPQLTNKLLVTPDSVALPNNQSVNVSQINAVTPLMGNGVTGTGSQRVTIASDNTPFPIKINSAGIASGAIASGAVASGAIASGAVASGAFASGSIAAGAVAAGASSFVKLEDVASADADAGVPAMAVRKATPANTSGTDGDYEMLQMSAGRVWTSSDITIGGTAVDGNSGSKSAQTIRVVLATDQPQLSNKLLVTPDANSAVNVAQINGVTALMGNGVTGTGSQRVTVASDNTPFAVKIDQTTPGTTNLVAVLGSRPFVVKGSINNATTTYTYVASPINVGGLITVSTGLPVGTIITALTVRIKVLGTNVSSGYGFGAVYIFDANPTASTFTDNTIVAVNTADVSKLIFPGISTSVTGVTVGNAYLLVTTGPRMAVDGSGNIYIALAVTASATFGSTNVLSYEIDGTY